MVLTAAWLLLRVFQDSPPLPTAAKVAIVSKRGDIMTTTIKKKTAHIIDLRATKTIRKSRRFSRPDDAKPKRSAEERWNSIAVAAYHKAEKRGFAPGAELQDWVEAEKEIDARRLPN